MRIKADTPEDYIDQLPEDRKQAVKDLRKIILENLPPGFKETISYGMIGYVVPCSIYPHGYHADPKQALPFINLASQKNYIALYHMGLYVNNELLSWFRDEFSKRSKSKLDMGKSCIRFKKPNEIPYGLIGELVSKITVSEWIKYYDSQIKR